MNPFESNNGVNQMKYRMCVICNLILVGFLSISLQPGFAVNSAATAAVKIVVLGSSTAEGTGPSHPSNAWVNRFRTYVQSAWHNSEVINLAKGGYTTYHIMPDAFTAPHLRPHYDPARNISKALSHQPTAIIINLPSNDATAGYTVEEQLANYEVICALAAAANIPLWISTTQPRNLSFEGRENLQAMRDSTFARFADNALDFWYGLAMDDGSLNREYDSGDGIHLNDKGHQLLFDRALISGAGLPRFDLKLHKPEGGEILKGLIEISWSAAMKHDPTRKTTIDISRDAGKNWKQIWSTTSNDTSYFWDSATFSDGLFNMIRVVVLGDSGHGKAQSSKPFIIDNPVNAAPEGKILAPRSEQMVSGETEIRWQAFDVESERLGIFLDWSIDGITWFPITCDETDNGACAWLTQLLPNSRNYRMRLRCSDGENWGGDTTGVFIVQNAENWITGSTHISGDGGGVIKIRVVDPEALTGHRYQIIFDDTSFSHLVYHVRDLTADSLVVNNATEVDGSTEGPLFDGVRLLIKNYEHAVADPIHSKWDIGNSSLDIVFSVPVINLGDETVYGFAQPSDYRIEMFDHVVASSSTAFGASSVPMKFLVQNLTEPRAVAVIFIDYDNDQTLSRLDQLFFVEPDAMGEDQLTWLLFFNGKPSDTPPVPGDIFLFYTLKPFTSSDVYEFTAVQSAINHRMASTIENFRLMQNYPNPFNPTTTITYTLSKSSFVEISVFNTLGQQVATLVSAEQPAGQFSAKWDAGILPSGIYFYNMKTGERNEIMKAVLIK